jgi:hypothetical protein
MRGEGRVMGHTAFQWGRGKGKFEKTIKYLMSAYQSLSHTNGSSINIPILRSKNLTEKWTSC